MLRAPGQLGLGRAYVAGALEVDDVDKVLELLDGYSPPPIDVRAKAPAGRRRGARRGAARVPSCPAVELRPQGRRHSIARDKRAVTHHYDVSNEFFALFLDESMTYSCAIWSRGADDARGGAADQARARLHQARGCRRASGCWTSAAAGARSRPRRQAPRRPRHRDHAVGAAGRARAAARAGSEGVADRVEIRVMDYRELRGERFDAIASIGMVEHVGDVNIDAYARTLAGLLSPGGRLLNHGIARLRHGEPEAGPFSERYVFPDAAPLHLSRVQFALERAGFETQHVEGFRHDYARTLREWTRRLDANPPRRCGSPAPSACACGRSTCAPRGAASRPASRRSTRCAPSSPSRSAARRRRA